METDNLELLQRMLLGEATQQIDRPSLLGDANVILAGNPAVCELLDYRLPDLLQRGPTDISRLEQDEVDQVFGILRERRQLTGTVWLKQRDGTGIAMEFKAWLVSVAGAPAWFAWFRPAVGQIPSEPIVLAEPLYA
jgi:PAS domain-containing protein